MNDLPTTIAHAAIAPKKPKKRRMLKLVQWLMTTAFLGFIFAVIGVALVIQHYSNDLPSTDQLSNYNPAVVTRLYAGDGKLMAEYAKEKRFFLPLSAIPLKVQQAFISAEDKNFYTHQGVDLMGTARALRNNVLNIGKGQSMAGGSTITQQVVKNFLLSSEKSFERKIKEAILAYRITNIYSKEKILELYLNEIYLGQGTYGVAAASVNYFDKSLDQLSTEEVALLAAFPKAPAYFDPAKNYDRALERRNYVISRMREDGVIDEAEEKRAKATKIITQHRSKDEVVRADFFSEEVRRALATMYGSNVLYEGGLYVKTTLNPTYQDYTDRALREALMEYDQRHGYRGPIDTLRNEEGDIPAALEKIRRDRAIPLYDSQTIAAVDRVSPRVEITTLEGTHGVLPPEGMAWAKPKLTVGDVLLVEPVAGNKTNFRLLQIPLVNGAMVVMDPHSGKVLAMSGGYAYGKSEFNRATQAKRQPGSVFKPFAYLTALENGFSPTSVIMDGPISLSQGPGLPMWTPKNFEGDFMGPITFRTALEKSRNAVTVSIAQLIGIKRIARVAKRFGLYDDAVSENYSMVLGAKETTLLKLTNAYSMIANGGRRVAPWFIERIDDRNGSTIFRRDTRMCEGCLAVGDAPAPDSAPTIEDERERVLDPRVAYQMTSLLRGAVERGTGFAARALGRPVAGKTGTTNESRDTWFIGYTPDLVVGTYIGFDTPRSLGGKETGGRVAIQGFIKFFEQVGDSLPKTDFRAPPGIREVLINRDTGEPIYDGDSKLEGVKPIREAFLTGGAIFKPANELQEELQDQPQGFTIEPEEHGYDINGQEPNAAGNPVFEQPKAGEMAPFQRPVDTQGYDPGAGAAVGTGGLY